MELRAPRPTERHELALDCVRAGIEAAHPRNVVHRSVDLEDETLVVDNARYDLAPFDRVLVVGGGKAAAGVADALEAVLDERIDAGAIVTDDSNDGDRIDHLAGNHPVPSRQGVESTRRVRDILDDADEATLVLAVVTGGASALLPAPVESVSLSDLRTTTEALLESGADISELNAVRKHLSTLKGGGLARTAAPATVVSLVVSDVVGNDLGVIASGPVSPDGTTFDDAVSVLDRYDLAVPDAVRKRLERGASGDVPETPKPGAPVFDRVTTHVLADGYTALAAAAATARDRGYTACILSSRVRGEAREAAKSHVAVGEEVVTSGNPVAAPAVILAGGETTVDVRGDGSGGPNLEFALSAALELTGEFVLASVDTDGKDGGTDVAGALVDAETVDDAETARDALDRNDAATYLESRDALVRTGPTGTNVNDLRVLVVGTDD
jgi:hydroxypyruvate reductase